MIYNMTDDEIAEYIQDLGSQIDNLERACEEWAETSQRNYQCAKHYFEALEKISQNTYGLQSIQEDYPDSDSVEYLQEALSYYSRLATLYQRIAREAIKDVEK
jgi:exonuclease VII small subunit